MIKTLRCLIQFKLLKSVHFHVESKTVMIGPSCKLPIFFLLAKYYSSL